jgi:hypothetical protein
MYRILSAIFVERQSWRRRTTYEMNMKQDRDRRSSAILAILGIVGIVAIGIASRFLLVEWPNFKPLLAIAIFLGFITKRTWVSLTAIAVMMIVSDSLIGFYDWRLMAAVYGGLSLAALSGCALRGWLSSASRSLFGKLGSVAVASLFGSIVFFLITNAACWIVGDYEPGLRGLWQSLLAGLPFFKYTLAGDLLFGQLIFAVYFGLAHMVPVAEKKAAHRLRL